MEEVEKVEDEVVFDNLHYTGNVLPTALFVTYWEWSHLQIIYVCRIE